MPKDACFFIHFHHLSPFQSLDRNKLGMKWKRNETEWKSFAFFDTYCSVSVIYTPVIPTDNQRYACSMILQFLSTASLLT